MKDLMRFILLALNFILQTAEASQMHYDNSALISFARKNADKFRNEIVETKGISIGSKAVVLSAVDASELQIKKYDVDSGEMIIKEISLDFLLWTNSYIGDSCKTIGYFAGQNAYGAKTTVRRQMCETFLIGDSSALALKKRPPDYVRNEIRRLVLNEQSGHGEVRIKMSPSQFRTIEKIGVKQEMDFTVGVPPSDVPVEYREGATAATIDNPVETQSKEWAIHGRIEEVKWLLPGEKTAITVWKR